jgi:homoserine O-acetyltransferase
MLVGKLGGSVFVPKFGKIVYETFGALNEPADNCVVLPTYYTGTDRSYLPMIGAGRALDPARWFIVIPNMLGNGVSDSPSNDPAYQNTTIIENVRMQRDLLAHLGVKRVALVYGWSMGAMQAFAWGALYPDFVGAILPVAGTARCWPLNYVFLEGVKAAMGAGKRAFGRAYAGWAYTAAFYRDELWRGLGYESLEAFLVYWEEDHEAFDARDLLAMLWTWQNGFLSDAELAGIKARAVVMPAAGDMYFVLEEALRETALMPNMEVRVLASPYGHCAGSPGRPGEDSAAVERAIWDLL